MQQHRHEAEHAKPRTARSGHERQMLADVWQQDMHDDISMLTAPGGPDDLPHAARAGIGIPPAVPQPLEEEEEEAPAAGDTFMVSLPASSWTCGCHSCI